MAGHTMSKRASDIDRKIGARIRTRRVELGISQFDLGTALGIAYQQVQKYERGTNRIAASRLPEIEKILKVPSGYFLTQEKQEEPDPALDFLSDAQSVRLLLGFAKLKPGAKRLVIDLVEYWVKLSS